jgi:hypothetical protein
MVLRVCSIALAILTVSSPLARATTWYYPNQEVPSPDNRWRLEAKSPDNAEFPGGRAPFASHFTYTLWDQKSGKVVWQRGQAFGEGSPKSVFVHNDKWVVIWTGGDELLILEPTQGRVTFKVDILAQFTKEEKERYVYETTAGPQWVGMSCRRFVDVKDHTYFVLRTWWDRRIIIDVANAKTVSDEGQLKIALDDADREYTLALLKRHVPTSQPSKTTPSEDEWQAVRSAAHLAGRLRVMEVKEELRVLEKSADKGCSSNSLRRTAQLSLRRLGARPACHAAYNLGTPDEGPTIPDPCPGRVELAAKIEKSMKPAEVLQTLGSPDFMGWPRMEDMSAEPIDDEFWEYDIDAESPFTLRIILDSERHTIKEIEKIAPPLWKSGNLRDNAIAHF